MAQEPATPNMLSAAGDSVGDVTKGAALEGFPAGSDLLLVDNISDGNGVGGTGFTAGYIADTNNDGTDNLIAASGADCAVNHILTVSLGAPPPGVFNRGDADGNSRINVLDSIIIIQVIVSNITAPFACEDIYDANDDGTVDLADGIVPLNFVFMRADPPAAPFRACDVDPTDDALTCTEANCQ